MRGATRGVSSLMRHFSTQAPPPPPPFPPSQGPPVPPSNFWPPAPPAPNSNSPPMMPPPAMPPPYRAPTNATHASPKGPLLRPADYIHKTPLNLGICIVPQGEMWVVERLGKYCRTLTPGFAILIPFLDRVAYVHSSKESAFSIPNQSAITKDNVIVEIDGVMFMKIVDAYKASYHIDNAIYNLIQMAMTTMRSEIGKLTLDALFEERSHLNAAIVATIQQDADEWGVQCKRYEIKDILVSDLVRQSMDLQAEAERRKRKHILESEGQMTAARNMAEGQKMAVLLLAEAERNRILQQARGEADALLLKASATAEALHQVATTIGQNANSPEAMQLRVAEQYVEAFGRLAKEGNTLILPANVSDPTSMIAQALGVYKTLDISTKQHSEPSAAPQAAAPSDPQLPKG
eukprot:CAMPEP_0174285550 /NCGR_PEP_ID=MMETSP0809-20121228/8934_1 /TAXON_ID=73025 ORGANISM="Eutreptiella gymnastica-like, Strain CCMP1594" /NCGR_SAMPLE_ID=MMETSP0809 /ASSEMBLY_ACC=CAM_ASM_000658 /LENGTH=404 /DNA_ID=CAMNT_0015381355 /DNA_START=91 /DNA_END=1305 /DNA_ORIENTATION=-